MHYAEYLAFAAARFHLLFPLNFPSNFPLIDESSLHDHLLVVRFLIIETFSILPLPLSLSLSLYFSRSLSIYLSISLSLSVSSSLPPLHRFRVIRLATFADRNFQRV